MDDNLFQHLLPLTKELEDKFFDSGDWRVLQHYKLDSHQLSRLSSIPSSSIEPALQPISIAITSSANTELLLPVIKAMGIKNGFDLNIENISNVHPQIILANFDHYFKKEHYDFVFVLNQFADVPLYFGAEKAEQLDESRHSFLATLKQLKDKIHQQLKATVVLQNIPRKPSHYLGSLDRVSLTSPQKQLAIFNQSLEELLDDSTFLFDVATLAEDIGLNQWYDDRMWFIGKIPFALDKSVVYAERFIRILLAAKGKSKKCLVLDLDHTLWGGVVGQDGVSNIEVGPGTAVGEAYYEFQHYIKQLKNRGMILCICSKNNQEDVLEAFDVRSEMPLKKEDFALIVANWRNKPSNIKDIAKQLNIGLDSMVFVDDTPLEREAVRQSLPDVAVPEMPTDPTLYINTLAGAGYFEAVSFTEEDKLRADSYLSRQKFLESLSDSVDISSSLRAIEMELVFKAFDDTGLKRVEQLVNKTNQFNLSTKRHNLETLKKFQQSSDYYTQQVYLKDKFADYGMIGVIIGKIDGDSLAIDTWLLSCRAIGRRVERAAFEQLISFCRANGISTIYGCYIKTKKNHLVENHFQELGFSLLNTEHSATSWRFHVDEYTGETLPFKSIVA